ncbi:uncharacterized protein LOC115366714 [Myripristis murdjan]|uniref:uncharacterized protein LOC115366714 n=1 Tax=Myripristis murdjan TaxID=586833 RepID=UPI001175D1E0|nr:uncharacterized protein LOC115366714 [Myripristis murdjan]
MRPRSRLLFKRGLLLPTIREGTEETLRDMNQANALHTAAHGQSVSSEDYFLSICHLAHPTFPSRDTSPDSTGTRQQDSLHQRLRLPRLGGSEAATDTDHREETRRAVGAQQEERKEVTGEPVMGCHGNSDPLEYLYGHQDYPAGLATCQSGNAMRGLAEGRFMRRYGGVWEAQGRSRAHSVPRASSPDLPRQRKSSCPELHGTTAPNISPKRAVPKPQAMRGSREDRDTEVERLYPAVKHSLISQWISECRSAWREARVRACMLPAIAEI